MHKKTVDIADFSPFVQFALLFLQASHLPITLVGFTFPSQGLSATSRFTRGQDRLKNKLISTLQHFESHEKKTKPAVDEDTDTSCCQMSQRNLAF